MFLLFLYAYHGALAVNDFYGLSVGHLGGEREACAQRLGADVVAMALNGGIPFAVLQHNDDAVGDLEAFLADVLDAVHKLASDAFVH